MHVFYIKMHSKLLLMHQKLQSLQYTAKQSVNHVIWFPNKWLLWASSIYWIRNIELNQCNLIVEQSTLFSESKTYSATISKSFSNNLIIWKQTADEIKCNNKNIFFFPKIFIVHTYRIIDGTV